MGSAETRRLATGALQSAGHRSEAMKSFTAIVERCSETGLYVGHIPGFPGAHSQGETIEELRQNLREVVELLLEEGPPELEAEFIGTQQITVP